MERVVAVRAIAWLAAFGQNREVFGTLERLDREKPWLEQKPFVRLLRVELTGREVESYSIRIGPGPAVNNSDNICQRRSLPFACPAI